MKYSMLRRNFLAISGKVSRNSCPLKNACLTSGQFGEVTTSQPITAKTTIVLTTAIRTPLAPSAPSGARIREAGLPSGSRSVVS